MRCVFVGYFLKEVLSQPPMPPPSEIFRQYILDPIPESVTNIKADQPHKIFGYTYTLRFNINRTDLALLIDSRPFVKVWNVKYKNGYLGWAWDTWHGFSMNGSTIIVYHPENWWRRKPAWFTPELLDNPEAYAFYKVGDRVNIEALKHERKGGERVNYQVLIYNEKEGEAYFIISNLK